MNRYKGSNSYGKGDSLLERDFDSRLGIHGQSSVNPPNLDPSYFSTDALLKLFKKNSPLEKKYTLTAKPRLIDYSIPFLRLIKPEEDSLLHESETLDKVV